MPRASAGGLRLALPLPRSRTTIGSPGGASELRIFTGRCDSSGRRPDAAIARCPAPIAVVLSNMMAHGRYRAAPWIADHHPEFPVVLIGGYMVTS